MNSQFESLEIRRLLSATSYTQQDLVSDTATAAARIDARLKNPWGLAVGPNGIEVADNGTGLGTMYDSTGRNVVGTVRVPGPGDDEGAPTGVVFNGNSSKFIIPGTSTSARFIFVTENGTVNAWSGVKADKTAPVVFDRSADG
ncbi:MAG: TIGR03118 family protein, partial [Tepidisphaeraceae bacterium]